MFTVQGQVKELDGLAHSFMAAAPADRKPLLEQAQAAADAVDTSSNPDAGGYVEYYIKTMQRVLDKGDAYVQQVRLHAELLLAYVGMLALLTSSASADGGVLIGG